MCNMSIHSLAYIHVQHFILYNLAFASMLQRKEIDLYIRKIRGAARYVKRNQVLLWLHDTLQKLRAN